MNKTLKKHILWVSAICLFTILLSVIGIGCPIFALLGAPCPTCGSTRALAALCRLDFVSYWRYQPFALPMLVAIWLILHSRHIPRMRWFVVVAYAVLGGNFLFYIWRLFV